jgi:hypothetical protein
VSTHLFELFLVASLVRVVQTSERLERRPHLRFAGSRSDAQSAVMLILEGEARQMGGSMRYHRERSRLPILSSAAKITHETGKGTYLVHRASTLHGFGKEAGIFPSRVAVAAAVVRMAEPVLVLVVFVLVVVVVAVVFVVVVAIVVVVVVRLGIFLRFLVLVLNTIEVALQSRLDGRIFAVFSGAESVAQIVHREFEPVELFVGNGTVPECFDVRRVVIESQREVVDCRIEMVRLRWNREADPPQESAKEVST